MTFLSAGRRDGRQRLTDRWEPTDRMRARMMVVGTDFP